ncbi:hypothetical protein XA68_16303 [Ophiocordyceps unilateralis]|uniref:Uncharacterized protein n=1 Tax=Ophiocordyceps unilateralis TaxID=268505 RepID=A0A2A9PKM1_OPHUN|nr:hypothetical protein XA68_16303 [Ophiocordyceps unilateralis]
MLRRVKRSDLDSLQTTSFNSTERLSLGPVLPAFPEAHPPITGIGLAAPSLLVAGKQFYSGTRHQCESSDEDDQFTDAQSGPASPRVASPTPKASAVDMVIRGSPPDEAPSTNSHDEAEKDAYAKGSDDLGEEDDPETPPANAGKKEMPSIKEDDSDAESRWTSGEPEAEERTEAAPTVEAEDRSGLDDFGDDFDEFAEGAQDDDFDDFADGFQTAPPVVSAAQPTPSAQPTVLLPFPIPDFQGLSPDEVMSSTESYLGALFPPDELNYTTLPPLPKDMSVFSTPRAAPLWSQLVAPPPLAPPDWIRSRTRRLFLVSLGVPVDLDEILPASKQKKLILPSLSAPAVSPRTSSDSRSASRLRQDEGNASPTSVDTQGKRTGSKGRKGPPPQPELDLVASRYLCTTTDEALNGMTDDELKEHVKKLESMQDAAKELLEFWKQRTDEKIGDREAFEGVIENLVKHARKVRK